MYASLICLKGRSIIKKKYCITNQGMLLRISKILAVIELCIYFLQQRAFDQFEEKGKRNWPQIFIFPEGTCTNAKGLINFKTGAFQVSLLMSSVFFLLMLDSNKLFLFLQPGCPVQPVLIRRKPEVLDTLTWTWHQSYGAVGCLWLTLCQWQSHIEVIQ